MSDNRAITAIPFDLFTQPSPHKVYDIRLGEFRTYDPPSLDANFQGTLYTIDGVMDPEDPTQLRQMSIAELVMCVCLARATEVEGNIIDIMAEMSENTNLLNQMTNIENQVLDGKSLSEISGPFTYYGQPAATAIDFLTLVFNSPDSDFVQLYNINSRLKNHEMLRGIFGEFTHEGTTYTNASDYLLALGINPQIGRPLTFYSPMHLDEMIDFLNNYTTPDIDKLGDLFLRTSIRLTSADVFDVISDLENEIRDYVVDAIRAKLNSGSVGNSVTSWSKDELITQMESKMDSLNSFSQEKMIELQSATNKRDQSYDMITNILKSLNTVQIGIANNI